ncbi:MAG: hypothetical protein Q4E83_03570 [bacterium]|nr:hypothetical protein [bacterium]
MNIVNTLDFLKKTKSLHALDFATCYDDLSIFYNFIRDDEQFIQNVNFGIVYLYDRTMNNYTIIDGLNRFLCISLFLHAICECHKKTTPKNEKAIATIRSKYLVSNDKPKLRLNEPEGTIYHKIIFGERLSGKEKESPIFKLLHLFWTQIKDNKLQASSLLKWLQKFSIMIVDSPKEYQREVYYTLNKEKKSLDHFILIKDFLKTYNLDDKWDNFTANFNNENDLRLFFKDFFVTKFASKHYVPTNCYENFVNYFATMQEYMSPEDLFKRLDNSAKLYINILNVELPTEALRKALIQIKLNNGEDTFAYLLNVYEDFNSQNITEATFLEILEAIAEHLRNRKKNNNNISFNELIEYLNAFISCK